MKQNEQIQLEKKRQEREKKEIQAVYNRFPDSDNRFFFIAGYTSGGVPYGLTWEEMGMEPWGGFHEDEKSIL